MGQYCNTSVAGGYCTRGCTFEGTQLQECPAGSICTSFGSAAQVCANICTGDGSCREGLQCNGVSGSNVKSCKPKG